MMDAPLFSIVIPTCNRRDALLRCLRSIERQQTSDVPFEVIVVVDGCDDATSAALRDRVLPFPLTLVETQHCGPGAARNAGAARARGTFLAFTEDDVELSPMWLSNAARHIMEAGCRVLEGSTVYADSGKSVRRFDASRSPAFIPCNLFVSRSVFHEVGGYASDFFDRERGLFFREDADFGFRLLDAGHRVVLADDVVVTHPRQWTTVAECFRHVRRYEFDPLLYKRHPARFREMIEVKRVLGLTVHRPQHYVALLGMLGVAGIVAAFAAGSHALALVACAVTAGTSLLFALKYWAASMMATGSIRGLLRLLPLSFLYLWAVLRGCLRYRVAGVLV